MKMVRHTRNARAGLDGDAFDLSAVGKIIGVGLNYRDHAEETGLPLPKEPTLFLKATSALCGPNDDIVVPRGSKGIDWEVELGVVIGAPGVYIEERAALDHVAGYIIGIDFSERVFYISRFMSVQPGDGILTGTPAGVGMGQMPPVYSQPGDVVTASIDGLGVLWL